MKRRDFLAGAATAALTPMLASTRAFSEQASHAACFARTYASPREAMQSPRETLAYLPAIYVGTGVEKPDYLATVDLDPKSASYSRVIDRLELPYVGDELHHFGWNACSSCHADCITSRRFLILPGLRSGRIYVIDTVDPRKPRLHKAIEPELIALRANLSAPHTVHCRQDGLVMISMLGDARGDAPGGFLLLDQEFEVVGRWEQSVEGMHYNYDFWYQPRLNAMVSSEWAAPNTFMPGFKVEDVEAGKYGQRLYFWDWQERRVAQTVDMGNEGRIPLEVRFHHNPDSSHGFAGAALSSAIWHWYREGGLWKAENVVQVEPVEMEGQPSPVPGLITDLVLSLDDRWLYFACWLHGDIRQYDVSDPARPKLAGRVWLGGNLRKGGRIRGKELTGGPQMLQLSLDGKRLYVTNSLFSSWDNQFYPDIAKHGSYLVQIDCDTDRGGLSLNEDFHVDFGREPHGAARAHEIRFPGGDCTSDIWV
jgi:selenium-binding protein 1